MKPDHIIDSLGRLEAEVLQSTAELRQISPLSNSGVSDPHTSEYRQAMPKQSVQKQPVQKQPVQKRSMPDPPVRQRSLRLALAACLLLSVVILLPFARALLRPHGGTGDSAKEYALLEFNGRYYQPIDNPEILVRYGLPEQITSELAGAHVSYLKLGEVLDYEETTAATNIELYEYASAPCPGVYILRDNDHYFAALFAGFHQFDTNTHVELAELYRVFHVYSPEDIASITDMGEDQDDPLSDLITDPAQLEAFFTITTGVTKFAKDETVTTGLPSFGNDDFQALMFGELSEEEQKVLHQALADDLHILRIRTADGLNFFLSLYPSYDWIYGDRAHSYYRMSDELQAWITENLQ